MAEQALELLQKIDQRWFYIHKNYKKGEKKGIRYLIFRIQRPLIKFHVKVYKRFNPKSPWLCPSAIQFLKNFLTNKMYGAEFGSGSSTYFFAIRSKHLVSIEHHKEWYNKVSLQLKNSGVNNVDYLFIPKEKSPWNGADPSFLRQWPISTDIYKYRKHYYQYFNALEVYEDNYFDYILIDGRARPESLLTSIKKLKDRGLLILDNSERDRYTIVFDLLKNYPSYTCTSGLTDTTFWVITKD